MKKFFNSMNMEIPSLQVIQSLMPSDAEPMFFALPLMLLIVTMFTCCFSAQDKSDEYKRHNRNLKHQIGKLKADNVSLVSSIEKLEQDIEELNKQLGKCTFYFSNSGRKLHLRKDCCNTATNKIYIESKQHMALLQRAKVLCLSCTDGLNSDSDSDYNPSD